MVVVPVEALVMMMVIKDMVMMVVVSKTLVKMMQLAEALVKMSHLSPVEKQLVAWDVDNSGQAEGSPRVLPHIAQL